jgi:hypothetical protein
MPKSVSGQGHKALPHACVLGALLAVSAGAAGVVALHGAERASAVGVGAPTAEISIHIDATPQLTLAGRVVHLRLRVSAAGPVAGVSLRVCNVLGAKLELISAPGASRTANRQCWAIAEVTPDHPHVLTLSARASPRAVAGEELRDSVTLSGANVPSVTTSASAHVLPPLSACGARAHAAAPRAHAAC